MDTQTETARNSYSILSESMRLVSWWIWLAFHPSYWLQNYDYSSDWDKELNALLDAGEFEVIDEYTADICGIKVWITNEPYAVMRKYTLLGPQSHRPSRWTIRRALRIMKQAK